jgi:hypothetical protein
VLSSHEGGNECVNVELAGGAIWEMSALTRVLVSALQYFGSRFDEQPARTKATRTAAPAPRSNDLTLRV